MRRSSSALTLGIAAVISVAAAGRGADGLDELLGAVSARVEAYYTHAQSVICTETVRLQPLGLDWMPDGRARVLVYELRVEWDRNSEHEPTVMRQLLRVDGHAPKSGDEPGCMDPKAATPDSLGMLLASHRRDYVFSWVGEGRFDKRSAVMFDYKGRAIEPPSITWKGDCVSVELPGRFRGRIWVDGETQDVLRVDERLDGWFDFRVPREHWHPGGATSMVIERADTTTRYRQVAFHDPDETLTLPSTIESFTIIRNAGVPRLRTTQTFADYRRFLTGGRLVKPGS